MENDKWDVGLNLTIQLILFPLLICLLWENCNEMMNFSLKILIMSIQVLSFISLDVTRAIIQLG